MDFIQNVPFFSIMISMFSGIVSSILSEKWAKRLNTAVILAVGVMSGALLIWLCSIVCVHARRGRILYIYDGAFSGALGQ